MAVEAQKAELCRSMLEKAKLATNSFEAESWLLTAKSLMPVNFTVQMTTYDIQCKKLNHLAAAETLTQMYLNFQEEPMFWTEVKRLVKSLQDKNDSDVFSLKIFETLLPALQLQLLLNLAEKEKEDQSQVDLLMLLLHRFPDHVDTFGLQLIDVLTKLQSTSAGSQSDDDWPAINDLNTRILVRGVLPVLLRNQELPLTEARSLELFNKAVLFYIRSLGSPGGNDTAELLKSFVEVFQALGDRLHWSVARRMKNFDLEAMSSQTKAVGRLPSLSVEAAYTAFVCLVLVTYQYSRLINRHSLNPSENSRLLVLLPSQMESATTAKLDGKEISATPAVVTRKISDLGSPSPTKRIRKNSTMGGGSFVGELPLNGASVVAQIPQCFKVIEPCYQLLSSDIIRSENEPSTSPPFIRNFFRVLDGGGSSQDVVNLSWLRIFLLDKLIYDGEYQQFLKTPSDGLVSSYCQRAAVFYAMKNYTSACEQARLAVSVANPTNGPNKLVVLDSPKHSPKLGLIECDTDAANYGVGVIISCLCDSGHLESPSDRMMGILLVLSQIDWRQYRPLLRRVVAAIKTAKGLVWPGLIEYVCLIGHLEELSSLNHSDDITLQIISNTRNSGLTRGVRCNKDVRLALKEKAAQSADDPIQVTRVIQKFLSDYGDTVDDLTAD